MPDYIPVKERKIWINSNAKSKHFQQQVVCLNMKRYVCGNWTGLISGRSVSLISWIQSVNMLWNNLLLQIEFSMSFLPPIILILLEADLDSMSRIVDVSLCINVHNMLGVKCLQRSNAWDFYECIDFLWQFYGCRYTEQGR